MANQHHHSSIQSLQLTKKPIMTGCPNPTHLCAYHQQSSSSQHMEYRYQSSSQQPNSAALKACSHRTSSRSVTTITSTSTSTITSTTACVSFQRRNYHEEKKMSDGKGKDHRRKESGTKEIGNRRGGEDTRPKEKERRTGHGGDGAKEETKNKEKVREVHKGNRGARDEKDRKIKK